MSRTLHLYCFSQNLLLSILARSHYQYKAFNLESLKDHRLKFNLILCYKIVSSFLASHCQKYFDLPFPTTYMGISFNSPSSVAAQVMFCVAFSIAFCKTGICSTPTSLKCTHFLISQTADESFLRIFLFWRVEPKGIWRLITPMLCRRFAFFPFIAVSATCSPICVCFLMHITFACFPTSEWRSKLKKWDLLQWICPLAYHVFWTNDKPM